MQKNVEEYMTEKERREKRLMIYTEEIQKKVLQNSEQVIQKLVEERHRQHMTQQEIADITGICPSNLARFEGGTRIPTLLVLEKYANALPEQNLREAMLVQGVEILGFSCLRDVIAYLEGKISKRTECSKDNTDSGILGYTLDFSEVKGQEDLIEAVVLAAAGGHNMLMIGEPGCGKTMIAQRIPTILPEMTEEECLEVTKIYSISGMLPNGHALIKFRPFRAPHHNASLNALIGGGVNAMPGEVSLAHNGVLFLDELAEFSRRTLDALRQPVEDKKVCISRVNGTHTFPSNFMFVTAMNPCPCGYYPGTKCRCTDYEVLKYRGKISGPIMDRIDIQKEVHPVNFFEITGETTGYSSELLRKKVEIARKIQQERYSDQAGVNCNAQMTTALIQKYCELDQESLKLLRKTSEEYGYSARVIHKLLRLARTSADIDKEEKIRLQDIRKVLDCRDLDNRYVGLSLFVDFYNGRLSQICK